METNLESQVTGLVLLGGSSRRMGQNKALLTVGGLPIIQRVLNSLTPLCADIRLIGNDPEPYRHLNLPISPDITPNLGPLMGLYSGLMASSNDLNLLLACDMPFTSQALLSYLLTMSEGYDVIIPRTENGLHPLCALYRRSTCIPAIHTTLALQARRVIAFFDQVHVREVNPEELQHLDPNGISLMNVNTPEELAKARTIAQAIDAAPFGHRHP